MSDAFDTRISLRLLFLGLVTLGGGGIVVYAGVQYQDVSLLSAGGVAIVAAMGMAAFSLRSYVGFGLDPSSSVGSVRRKLKHFWSPAAEAAAPRGATGEEIAAAERELGVKLPSALVRLLRAQDGGEPRYPQWAPALAPEHGCSFFLIDTVHGTRQMVDVSRHSIQDKTLPAGVVCICGYADDDWQLCLDYREGNGEQDDRSSLNRGGRGPGSPELTGAARAAIGAAYDDRARLSAATRQEHHQPVQQRARRRSLAPSVVAFDEEEQCYRLAETFEAFVADLHRSLHAYVYAPDGVLGKAVDDLLSNLAAALEGDWQPHPRDADIYVLVHRTWTSPSGGPATFELRPNKSKGPDGKRVPAFPETWSYRVLPCAIHPRHREGLERRLGHSGYKWWLVHQSVERLLTAEALLF
jgi:hypothetical protein